MAHGEPKSTFRLALFRNDATIVWHASIPARLPLDLLAKDIHAFNAARSISEALLTGIQHAKGAESNENPSPIDAADERRARLRPPEDCIVAQCKGGSLIAAFPMDAQDRLWLGLFSTGFSLFGTEKVCNLLHGIALSSEILSINGIDPASKLVLFWETMTTASLRNQVTDEVVEKTMEQVKDVIRST